MNFQVRLIDDILSLTFISHSEICSNNIFVESNPARVEIVQVSKVNSQVYKTKQFRDFNLSTVGNVFHIDRFSDCVDFFSKEINTILLHKLELTEDVEVIKVKKNYLFGLFSKYLVEKITDNLKYYNWIICSNNLKNQLSKVSTYVEISDVKSKIDDITIFFSTELEKDNIFAGMSDSLTCVFKNDISIEKTADNFKLEINYLIESQKITKFILV